MEVASEGEAATVAAVVVDTAVEDTVEEATAAVIKAGNLDPGNSWLFFSLILLHYYHPPYFLHIFHIPLAS